jgi:lipopolysaccharide/colanic/teichoic acid biosynthesis glycosyltransferase
MELVKRDLDIIGAVIGITFTCPILIEDQSPLLFRQTRVGKVLRRWSLDEVPQFFNVLRGEMSLVSPRPEKTWVVDPYMDEQHKRLTVKPGLTGLMQINSRDLLDDNERFRLDIAHVENYSVIYDLGILFKTIPAILSGKGAF